MNGDIHQDLLEAARRLDLGEPLSTTAAELGFTPSELKEALQVLGDLDAIPPSQRRTFKISGHPVTRQEVLDQATMIRGNTVRSIGLAVRIIREDGRDVDLPAS